MAEVDATAGTVASFAEPGAEDREYLHLVVENMACPSCIRDIEQSLRSQPGVIDSRVNFSTRRVRIQGEAGKLEAERLIGALADRGYRALPYDPARLGELSNAEGKILLRAMGVAGFGAANVMLLSVSVWSGLGSDMGEATRALFHWFSALIALPCVAYAGRPFFRSAAAALGQRRLNMDVPISLAVLLATGLSLYRTMAGADSVYFDASLMLLFFLLVGRYLDRQARARARSAVENLLSLRALAATVVGPDGTSRRVPAEALASGMTVAVAPGERIPADGAVVSGRSELDTSLVTGESLPTLARTGDRVFAGFVNLVAPLRIRVEAADDDTLLAEIVRLMEAAEQRRGRFVRLADRAARIYAPAVHGLALVTFAGWLAVGDAGWEAALMNAVAVLIITCPCALGLAVPAVQVVAAGRLFKTGVLVKTGGALERLAEVDTAVFDKTGTLTLGAPALANAAEIDPRDLALAASLAGASRHPLSRAIVAAAGPAPEAPDVREEAGRGLIAATQDGDIRLGNRRWCGVDAHDAGPTPEDGPELWLARGAAPPVRFVFHDQLRPGARETIGRLRHLGLDVLLLSGDRDAAVRRTAEAAGIAAWRAGQRPDQKIAVLEALRGEGHKILMVGDGLNDAPALAAAHASISPSTAADVSQTSADFVFQGSALGPVADALEMARAARRLVYQNFALAFAYNLITIPLAMAGQVTPLVAAAAMSASSIVVTVNALRLRLIPKVLDIDS